MSAIKRLVAQVVYWSLTLAFVIPVASVLVVLLWLAYQEWEQFMVATAITFAGVLAVIALLFAHSWARENK